MVSVNNLPGKLFEQICWGIGIGIVYPILRPYLPREWEALLTHKLVYPEGIEPSLPFGTGLQPAQNPYLSTDT